jgi:hypothetical protein
MADEADATPIIPGVTDPKVIADAVQRAESDPEVQAALRQGEALFKVIAERNGYSEENRAAARRVEEGARHGQAPDPNLAEPVRLVVALDYSEQQMVAATSRALGREHIGPEVQSKIVPSVVDDQKEQAKRDILDQSITARALEAIAGVHSVQAPTADDRRIAAEVEQDALRALATPQTTQRGGTPQK